MNDTGHDRYLLIDVTTLMRWNRSPVGIIRTQLEFVNHVVQTDTTAKYCYFTNTRDDIREMPRSEVEAIVAKLLDFKNNPVSRTTHVVDNQLAGLRTRFARLKKAQEIYRREGLRSLLVAICKKTCPLKLKSVAKKIYVKWFAPSRPQSRKLHESLDKWLFAPEMHLANNGYDSFLTPQAVVVSIGLDWDHSNYPMLYWLKKKIGFEFVGAFYDGIPVVFPELVQSFYFSQKFFLHLYYLVHLSDRIFCISEYSKSQLSRICDEHYIARTPLLKTIYLGDTVFSKEPPQPAAARKHNPHYILYVSTIEARKNHKLLLQVWKNLLNETPDIPDLVLVGMMGWGVEELREMYSQDGALRERVHFYDDVDDAELVGMYKNAMFTVFPSFVEGWGLGAVESMLYGKPCIISDCAALIEATQGLMPSVAADDVEGWTDEIRLLISDESELKRLQTIIARKFRSRSWREFGIEFAQFAKASS